MPDPFLLLLQIHLLPSFSLPSVSLPPKPALSGPHELGSSNFCLPGGLVNGEEGAKGSSGCLFLWLLSCRVTSGWLCPPIQGPCFSLPDSLSPVGSGNYSLSLPLGPPGGSSSSYWPWIPAEFCAQGSLAPYTLPTVNGSFIKPASSASEPPISCWTLSLTGSLRYLSCLHLWDLCLLG